MMLESIHNDNEKHRHKKSKGHRTHHSNAKTLDELAHSGKKYSIADLDKLIDSSENVPTEGSGTSKGKLKKKRSRRNSMKKKHDKSDPHKTTINNECGQELELEHEQELKYEDRDVEMIDMEDEETIELISNQLAHQRSEPAEDEHLNQEYFGSTTNILLEPTSLQTIFVIDTNFIISHLQTLEDLRKLCGKYHHVIMIPLMAVEELDGLKKSSSTELARYARNGNDWIYKNLSDINSGVMGQKLRQKINRDVRKDDAILDCCLYFKETYGCFTILMSNDKNLCAKALTEEVLTVSYRKGMTAELIASKVYEENITRYGGHQPSNIKTHSINDNQNYYTENVNHNQENTIQNRLPNHVITFEQQVDAIYHELTAVVISSTRHIMMEEYGEDLSLIDFDVESLNNIMSCANCIYDFWISVFSEYFNGSKIRRDHWKDLPKSLIELPRTEKDLQNILFFWKDILEYLFIKRQEAEYQQLQQIFQQWNQILHR